MESKEAQQSVFIRRASYLCEIFKESEKQLTGEGNRVSRPKMQRIPRYMAEKVEFQRYYKPLIISFTGFRIGERYKKAWAAMYLKDDIIDKVVALYMEMHDEEGGLYRLKPKWLKLLDGDDSRTPVKIDNLIMDGCCVLQLLEKSDDSVDPEKELSISIDKLVRVHQDLLIMDNQIPFEIFRLLCEDEARLERCLHNFLRVHGIQTVPKLPRKKREDKEVRVAVEGDDEEEEEEEPVHLLDYLRRALLMRDQHTFFKDIKVKRTSLHLRKYRIGTIRELKAAGIRVTKHSHNNSVLPSFKDGMLHLPQLIVDGSTAHIFLNLVAYEMCPDFRNQFEISSFLVFMSSLIDQPEDVKELRMGGIIINELASDKEVADLFNKMDTILVPETPLFAHVRDQIHSHFESKRSRIKMLSWMGEASNTFFRSPWTIIALLAATLGLVLTFIQTWFAMHPKAS